MDLQHEKRLTEVEERSKSNSHRLDNVEKKQNELQELTTSVRVLAEREENVENDVKEIKSDVKTLTEKPGKKWDSLIEKVVFTIVAALIGFLLGQIGLGG